jgi:hypothetical protein
VTINARSMWLPEAAELRRSETFKAYARRYWLPYWRERGFPSQCRDLGGDDFECS